ncbi:Amuc_1098 family type IV pilus outer membrane protein [Verrucomicrobiota bacterium sgz303538]
MMKPPLGTTIASILGVAVITPTTLLTSAIAGDTGAGAYRRTNTRTETTVERETIRRRDYLQRGEAAIDAGERALRDKDYEKAVAQFKLACDLIPNAPLSARLYRRALEGFCEASVRLAEQRIAEGRYADAELILRTVLDERYDPHCRRAQIILANLEEPGFYNKTITPKFRANVEQVKQYFVEAKGFYDSGRYDLAFKRCEQILNIDPYNIAARKMQEEINKKRDDYAIEGYNHTRSYMTWQVDKAWDRPVRKFGIERESKIIQENLQPAQAQRIANKLQRIIIPRLEFREATIREAIDFLKKKSFDLDDPNEPNRGVNIVLKLDTPVTAVAPEPTAAPAGVIPGLELPGAAPAPVAPVAAVSPNEARITVSLTNIPLGEALRYVTGLAGLKFKVEQYAVSVVPQGTPTETLITKEWKVNPGFLSSVPAAGGTEAGGLAAPAGSAPNDATRGGSSIAKRAEAKDFLQGQGVAFPPGSSAIYLPSSSKLVVRNTQENLDLIDAIVEASTSGGPVQVEIESKFVEISQNNLKELSFDWLIGQSNVGKSHSVFVGGGTAGNTPQTNPTDFPFVGPGNTPIGTFPVTSGLRSGNLAISQNAIDALLFGLAGNSALSPATAALSGVFTDPQFQVVIRALNQKKGVDLLSAPRVTTKSGQRAVIEIIREFRYPTEFDPPQIPQNFGNQNNGGTTFIPVTGSNINPLAGQSQGSFPVTPTTPTAFETRNTGVTLEVEPVVGPDNYTIDLNLVPQVVEFEGFINYGSPIQTTSTNALGQSITNVITPNVINQPIFSTRKVTTSVSIFDGQTVVLGGLMREDVQKVEDKVPLLGDIPLLGRLFRSNVDQHLKRNLVIFVSARLINPAGEPVHAEEEKEELVETLPVPEITPELPLMPK